MTAAAAIREKHDGELADRSSVRLWLRLLSCTMTIEKIVRRRLEAEFGTTLPRFDVMAALERAPDGVTMGALSRALLVSNGNVTGIVQKLAAEGLVSVEPLPRDRRASIARLTDAGAAQFRAQAAAHHDWIDAMFAELGQRPRDELHHGLALLKAALAHAQEESR